MKQNLLLKILETYSFSDFYTLENIPPNKLQNAIQHFPVDLEDTALALLDTTSFGSAKTGLVIGLKGIYFNNDWATRTDKNFISWDELAYGRSKIGKGKMFCVLIAPNCELSLAGSHMKRDLLINLLNQIVELYRSLSSEHPMENSHVAKATQPQNIANLPSSSNDDIYQQIVPELMAVCIAADGEVEDSEIEMASNLIDGDELITDKTAALEALQTSLELLVSDKARSSAIFKLKVNTISSKVTKIDKSESKERLEIILEAMMESVSENTNEETSEVVNSIKKKLIS